MINKENEFLIKCAAKAGKLNAEVLSDLIAYTDVGVVDIVYKLFSPKWVKPTIPQKVGDYKVLYVDYARDRVHYSSPQTTTLYFSSKEDAELYASGRYVSDYRSKKEDNHTYAGVRHSIKQASMSIDEWLNLEA